MASDRLPADAQNESDGDLIEMLRLREAVLNAVAYRNYSSPSPIQIRVYDDRIALWNPGTLSPDWTLNKLMGTHASAPYNPRIANTFFVLVADGSIGYTIPKKPRSRFQIYRLADRGRLLWNN